MESVKNNNWKYLLYSDIDRLMETKNPRLEDYSKDIV